MLLNKVKIEVLEKYNNFKTFQIGIGYFMETKVGFKKIKIDFGSNDDPRSLSREEIASYNCYEIYDLLCKFSEKHSNCEMEKNTRLALDSIIQVIENKLDFVVEVLKEDYKLLENK